jgi:ankyrin repeat protein
MSSRRGDVPSSREEARGLLLPSLDSLCVGMGALTYQDTDAEDREADSLIDACVEGRANAVRALLTRGADVNARDAKGDTPLDLATCFGHADCVELLLQCGAVVDVRRSSREPTPLLNACFNGHVHCAKLLLQSGADVDARTLDGLTPLHRACFNARLACVRLLLEHGVELNAVNRRRKTALHIACFRNNVDCVRLLLECGADPDARDEHGETPLHWTYHFQHVEHVRLLLAAKANVDEADNTGKTPLHLAAVRRNGYAPKWCDLLSRVEQLRERGLVAADGRVSLDWTGDTHALFHREERAAVEGAQRALLLAEARRAGCALGEDAVESVLRAVAR